MTAELQTLQCGGRAAHQGAQRAVLKYFLQWNSGRFINFLVLGEPQRTDHLGLDYLTEKQTGCRHAHVKFSEGGGAKFEGPPLVITRASDDNDDV